MINTDLCIVGSGPSSLLAVLEAGLLNMRCYVVSGFDHEEISPAEPSPSDICLKTMLTEHIQVFDPVFSCDERIKNVSHQDNTYYIITDQNKEIQCRSIVVVV
jgi:thioredoxin reductase